jgi:hypothetical protein
MNGARFVFETGNIVDCCNDRFNAMVHKNTVCHLITLRFWSFEDPDS